MGCCCCGSSTVGTEDDFAVTGPPPVKPYTDLPSIAPAVYIHLTIPPQDVISDEDSCTDKRLMQEPPTKVDYDKLTTDLSTHTGLLIQLNVEQQGFVYFKRMCTSDSQPKPIIIVTVTDPEDSGWADQYNETLYDVINEAFGIDRFQIIFKYQNMQTQSTAAKKRKKKNKG